MKKDTKKYWKCCKKTKVSQIRRYKIWFGISYDSAKRDLRLLEEQGMLKRTHGGAILRETIGAQYNIGDLTAKERIAKVDQIILPCKESSHLYK